MTVYSSTGDESRIAESPTAAEVTYSNTSSGLAATDVQDAIDEVADKTFEEMQINDLVITSNNVLQDTDLVIPLTAGTWLLESVICTSVNATPDMEIALTYSGTTTASSLSMFRMRGTAGTAHSWTIYTLPFSQTETTTDVQFRHMTGKIVVSDSGTLKWQARQVTSSGTSVTFYSGNFLRVTKIA